MGEPWLMLPFLYSTREKGIFTEYGHCFARWGMVDVINELPGKETEYYSYLRGFFENIYSGLASNNQKYFVDKTPRYFYIIPEIIKIFPDAKFIFIFRNPVQVYASYLKSYGHNRLSFFSIQRNYFDLTEGPHLLSKGYELVKNKAYRMQYEDFVKSPEKYLREIFDYLELEYDKNLLNEFDPKKLAGRYVDPNTFKYGNKIESTTVDKWKKTFNTRFRKKIVSKYVEGLNEETLRILGYDKAEMLEDLKSIKEDGKHSLFRDMTDYYSLKLRVATDRFSYW